ncbi:MAG: heparin lyase I family protein, partial [Mycobacteriales bacterium]
PNPDPTRIAQSTFRAQGQRSYRFEMHAGDDSYGARAELGQAMPARAGFEDRLFQAGQERWIALQYYLPAEWPSDDTWQNLFQIKPISGGGGGPSIGVDGGRNAFKLYGNSNVWGSTAGNIFDGAGSLPGKAYPLTRGRWIKLTFHVVFSADPAVGSLEVFGDLADGNGMRTLVSSRNRATMKYLTNGTTDPSHLRVGIYRDPAMTATATMYVDGITVASTRAAAEAGAYSPA